MLTDQKKVATRPKRGPSIEETKNTHAMLKAIELKYPEGKCLYCMRENRQIMAIDCGLKHKYCSTCIINLCKITRIKKGLVHRFKY